MTAVTGPTSTPIYGQKATFTATVTDTRPSGGTPTGSVEFFDGSTDLGPATFAGSSGNSATFTFSTSTLWAGTHTIYAYYTPSGLFQQSHGSLTNQVIDQRPITVTAVPNTKPYDGTTSAAATPTITSGSLVSGDMPDFTESYTTANVGTGLTLAPSGTVGDGKGGNNYAVEFVNSTAGTITQLPSPTKSARTRTSTGRPTTSPTTWVPASPTGRDLRDRSASPTAARATRPRPSSAPIRSPRRCPDGHRPR